MEIIFLTMVRVAILWQSLPNYLSKCVEALAEEEKIEVLVYCQAEGAFPNILDNLRKYDNVRLLENNHPDSVANECYNFRPHLAVFTLTRSTLTHRSFFPCMASRWRKSGTLVIGACDHFWKGDWRDYANWIGAKIGWFSHYDAIMVPGVLGKMYARKIGFAEKVIFDGLYTCDTEIFQPIGLRRHSKQEVADWPRVFLFVGQFIHRKGLDILLESYQAYRRQVAKPWDLWVVGKGYMTKDLEKVQGVRNLGQQSSSQIAGYMNQAGCFVIPSRIDHWPLVIHEATSAGLPIVASSMCGSSVELVQSGFNGYVFPTQDKTALSKILLFMAESGLAREMGKNSLQIASRFSPELWARKVLYDIPLFLRGKPLIKQND
jgi:glycosyltransferase involved in cell wall biosynthesis